MRKMRMKKCREVEKLKTRGGEGSGESVMHGENRRKRREGRGKKTKTWKHEKVDNRNSVDL